MSDAFLYNSYTFVCKNAHPVIFLEIYFKILFDQIIVIFGNFFLIILL